MAKWTRRTTTAIAQGLTSVSGTFPAPAVGSLMLAHAVSGAVISTPAGWTLLEDSVADTGTYVWTKIATGAETSIAMTLSGPAPTIVTVYEFPAGTTVAASSFQTKVNRSGVAATGLTGLDGSSHLLMHFGSWTNPTASPPATTLGWSDATVTDVWQSRAGTSMSIFQGIGYRESSTLTSWAPTTVLGSTTGIDVNSERITVALTVAAPAATPLATPTVTITAENDPTTIGGSNGSIQGTIGNIDPNADRVELAIATGHGQTTGFTTVNADAPTPFTITGRGAGNYTVGVRAHPAS